MTNPIRDTWGRTRNWADSLNIFNESQGPERDYDPVFKAEKLGAVVNQGVLAFITMVSPFWIVDMVLRSLRGCVWVLGCEWECELW